MPPDVLRRLIRTCSIIKSVERPDGLHDGLHDNQQETFDTHLGGLLRVWTLTAGTYTQTLYRDGGQLQQSKETFP